MFGLSPSRMSVGNGTGTVRHSAGERADEDATKGETRTAAGLDHDVVHGLGHVREPVDLLAFLLERDHEAPVVFAHLRKLGGDLPGELDAVFQGRIGLEGLALDLLEQVWAPAQELVVRELPCLDVRGRALRTRGLLRGGRGAP